MTKICSKCGVEKELNDFPFRKDVNNYRHKCKKCVSIYNKKYQEKNKIRLAKQRKEYRKNNSKKIQTKKKKDYIDNNNKYLTQKKEYYKKNRLSIIEYQKEYRKNNKEKISLSKNIYETKKISIDLNYKLKKNLRGRILLALKTSASVKAYKTESLLGCTIETARKHLESQFTDGMTWNNHGLHGWHIDHIIPCASFDLTDPEEQKKCFHYTNLQPLWAEDNLKKGAKLDYKVDKP